ncbi:MAG TPA: OmpA family protein [Chitinophagaceae bacterium]|jgi:outer membrane protein OmpA-like peptidoglycan-associated protein|nr:OmpA family protein [Chitinophagaceae bacterium]
MKRIILLALLCGGISITYAQTAKTTYTVSGGLLGAANLTDFRVKGSNANGIDYDTKLGWSLGGWLNFPLGTTFSLEPQLMYSSYRYRTNTITPLLLNDGSIHYVSIPLLLKIHASDRVALALGAQVDLVTSVDDKNNLAVKSDFNKTSWSLSGGVEIFPHGVVTPFARYVHGMSNMDNRLGHSSEQEYLNQNIQIGLKVKLFGKKKEMYQAASTPIVVPVPDSDGDGIADDVDKCPNVAGLAKYDGCPIPDSDGDGINDEEDKCPNQAGLSKYNGCPIPDSDGDGINDEEDKCPNQAGTAKYEGCPIPDNDGDGINNEEDKCPDLAGIAANNGCPEVPANVSKTLGVAAQKIKFGSTNATLTTNSNASLDQVVTIMNENPGLMIKVEAHTDNAGDDDKNMQLSKDRAEAVKTYLVNKGISPDRIATEGLGETTPIADNNTAAGRMKNRRVEIRMQY